MAPEKGIHLLSLSLLLSHIKLSLSLLLSHIKLLGVVSRVHISHSPCVCWITGSHVLPGLRGLGMPHARTPPPARSSYPSWTGHGTGHGLWAWALLIIFLEEFSLDFLHTNCRKPNGQLDWVFLHYYFSYHDPLLIPDFRSNLLPF